MLLVRLTMLRKLRCSKSQALAVLSTLLFYNALAQDNSPYSRYGLGNQVPTTNVANRGMGGVAAAYNDAYTVNYANPASYAFFSSFQETNSRKLSSGRVAFNIGADLQSRTLTDRDAQSKFSSPNILFSHVMMGVPVRKNWGLAFGLRPLTSINYKIQNTGVMRDPNTNLPIDSFTTVYEGQGGVYLASLGTAVKFKTGKSQYLSLGVNGGYMFGHRDYSTRLSFINDSIRYSSANYENKTSIGGLYFDAGLQYHFKAGEDLYVGLGAYGNWKQKINTSRNFVAETYTYNPNLGNVPIDTAYSSSNIKSNILYPSSITGGFTIQKLPGIDANEAGWIVGADFTYNNRKEFRSEGQIDTAVKSNWQAKVGAEFHPIPKKSYLSRTLYRVGFFTGPDYIYLRQKTLPTLGVSVGVGLPIANYSPQARYQASMVNLSFEFIKRGNNDNILKENLYRLSLGFSLTDLWFIGKTKYFED